MFSTKLPQIESLSPTLYYDPGFDINAAKIMPGELYVTERNMMVVTVLGSCVCACVRDRYYGLGGMNHFILPDQGGDPESAGSNARRYGEYAMETLIAGLIQAGAHRQNLEAKIFGGATLTRSTVNNNTGELTAKFLQKYMKSERIKVAAKSIGGTYPRKVYFFPRSGRVLVKRLLKANNNTIVDREQHYRRQIDRWS